MTEDRYYSSVFGGQVCRDCGSVVLDPTVHDEFHEGLMAWLRAALETD